MSRRTSHALPSSVDSASQCQRIVVERWHPTPLNKLLQMGRWASRSKRADAEMVMVYARRAGVIPATVRRRLRYEIWLRPGQRACDPDAYNKSLRDALVKAKLLVNDSHRWVAGEDPKYVRSAAWWGTIIELEDL